MRVRGRQWARLRVVELLNVDRCVIVNEEDVDNLSDGHVILCSAFRGADRVGLADSLKLLRHADNRTHHVPDAYRPTMLAQISSSLSQPPGHSKITRLRPPARAVRHGASYRLRRGAVQVIGPHIAFDKTSPRTALSAINMPQRSIARHQDS